MKRRIGNANAEQRARFEKLVDFGCICCKNLFGQWIRPEIHHINDTGRNMGHDFTIPLCPYHHRASGMMDWSSKELENKGFRAPGPPGGKTWERDHGTEAELLETVNNALGLKQDG